MKPGIPWSVKGIEPEVREAAKHAARRAGMTLGEWLNGVILDQNEHMLGASQVETANLRENFLSSPHDTPPLNRDAAPRSERPRAALQERPQGQERKDDNALRLHEIAQQLAELAQKERQSAAVRSYDAAPREDEQQQAIARILDRIDDNERQTVEALTAVNDRLSFLSHQVTGLGRAPLAERPEDVPGYSALESAIRNVVEHIETSERRNRDQFAMLQERLAGVAERAMTPPPLNGEELMRALPALSGLEARLAEILNRIQRSEGSLAERLEHVRTAAEHAANQAQSATLTAARGEMRDLESRLMSALGEMKPPAAETQALAMTEISAVRDEVAGLGRRLEEFRAGFAGQRDVHALQVALEQLSTRVAQGADMRPFSNMDKRLAELEVRVTDALRHQGDGRALQRLEESLASVSDRVSQTEAQLGNMQAMERAIRQLYEATEQSRETASRLAEEAAGRAIERLAPQQSDGPSPELRALEEGLRAVRESASMAERRNQDTLEAVHETLAQIVAKLTEIESRPSAMLDTAAGAPAPGMPDLTFEQAATDFEAATSAPDLPDTAAPLQEPLSAGDDFIAAARRAAQAAATQPSVLRAEYAVQDAPPPAKRSMFSALRMRKGKSPQAETAATPVPAGDASARSGSRKRLIYAGLVLLMAASFIAYKNYVKPMLPAAEPAQIQAPSTPSAAGKTGRLEIPADRMVTGSLPKGNLANPQATGVAASLPDVPPAELGSLSLRKAAAEGDPKAQFIIASRYLEGQSVARDMAKAADWYRLAAGQGLAPAQYRLATLYELGRGVPKNLATALVWYERAAVRGNVKAMHNAAVILAGTQAGPPDYAKAFRWFKAAAEQGFKDSQFNTAILYERGLGAKANLAEAYFWYSQAAKQGEADARLRANAIGKALAADQLAALGTLLRNWKPKSPDESANIVAIVEADWNVPDTGHSVEQSSLTSAWRAPRV